MSITRAALLCCLSLPQTIMSRGQVVAVNPQVRSRVADGKVTVVDIAPHFVSAIRVPEPVNSIAVGDPALFQVEHSEHEPCLVLVKALTERHAETNLIISTIHGRQFSLLLISLGTTATVPKADFLLQYKPASTFEIEPEVMPFPLIGQTKIMRLESAQDFGSSTGSDKQASFTPTASTRDATEANNVPQENLPKQLRATPMEDLLERQKKAPLPTLYGQGFEGEDVKGDRLRVGVSEVLDGGDQVTALFSVVNTSKHAILLMPPQVQLGGKSRAGKLVKHDRWSTAEQLPVADFLLSRRRLETGGRVDGVVVFERPPYKQSNEQLFLQMAESGAVDRPALAPVGFGVSSVHQEEGHGKRAQRD